MSQNSSKYNFQMKAFTTFLLNYNTLRNAQSTIPFVLAKVLLVLSELQILSFVCLHRKEHEDLIATSVGSVVSLFNLPFLCKTIGIPLLLPLAILLFLNFGYLLMTLLSIFLTSKYKKMQDWSLNALCKLEHYTLKSEVVFLFSLAIGMEAIFQPQNCVPSARSTNMQTQKIPMSLGVALVSLSVLQYYWRIYVNISVSYDTESIIELRNRTSMVLRGMLLPLISVLAHLESPVGVFVGVGVYLLLELLISMILGSHPNIKVNSLSLWVAIIHLPLYAILLLPLCSNPTTLVTGKYSQRSIGVLLLAPFAGKLILNLERRRIRRVSHKAAQCFANRTYALTWLETTQLDNFLKQIWSTFANINSPGSEIYGLIETIIRSRQAENQAFLKLIDKNLMEDTKDQNTSEYPMKMALKSSLHDFITSVYSTILSSERKSSWTSNMGCYLSHAAFHKDITGNHGKAFIVLARLQKILGSSASARTIASMWLAENDLQRQVAGTGSQKTISADLLFSFIDRSEKVQTSIENYVSEALSFYETLQKPVINTKDIKTKGKKLLNERTAIIKELDSLVQINEYHQQTLLLYEFFLSEIVEEKAEGRFFQIKNRMDIFRVEEYYALYRQQKLNANATELETLGWDMSIEFFASQLNDSSDYAVVVFSLNPDSNGKIMRCSSNLYQSLGFEDRDLNQMNISDMEATLFNPQNLKTLRDKILKGEASLKNLPEVDSPLYMKHRNGSLIAYAFVADVEIYSREPCITCYLRKKQAHEQEFVLFSLENKTKLIGMSKVLLSDVLKCSPNFNKIASDLNIIELIPTLETILPNTPTNLTWSESEALLVIPNVPRLSISQAFYLINYSGKIQAIPLVEEKIGIIKICYSERISPKTLDSEVTSVKFSSTAFYRLSSLFQNSTHQIKTPESKSPQKAKAEIAEEDTNIPRQQEKTAVTFLNTFKSARVNLFSQKSHEDIQSIDQTIFSKAEVNVLKSWSLHEAKYSTMNEISVPGNNKAQLTEIELAFSSPRMKLKPKAPDSVPRASVNAYRQGGTSPFSVNEAIEPKRVQRHLHGLNQAGGTEKITLGRASSVGSSIGAHLGFLRSIIIQRKTPAVLTAVNLFGLISLVSTMASILAAFFILSSRYSIFTLFAQSASFPSFMRAISPAYVISTELEFFIQFFPPVVQPLWESGAAAYSQYFQPFSLDQYYRFVLNFNLPFLSKDILSASISASFLDFPQLNRDLSFYEANDVFQAYTYKLSKYNFYSGKMDPALLNWTRTFIPAFNDMYKNISDENFKNIYSLHESTNLTLDAIMVVGVIISVVLMIAFIPIYWRYQKMEMVAFTKLCGVTMHELEPSLKKLTLSYEHLFGKTLPALKNFQENLSYHKKHTNDRSRGFLTQAKGTRLNNKLSKKKAIIEKSSNFVLMTLVLFVSLLLSGTYIVTNIAFKNANAKILPFILDIEKISAGLPACFTAQAIMTRLFSEIANPQISQTLPALVESYEGTLNESMAALKEMNNYLISSMQRTVSNDIFTETTKEMFQNLTDSKWCWLDLGEGGPYSCQTLIKGVANSGFFATLNQLMEAFTSQITKFTMNPTLTTIYSFYFSPDVFEFILMNLITEAYLLGMLNAVQADVGSYTEKLHFQTYLMLAFGLLYNVVLLCLLWIPTIRYLRKRFILARSIFLLVPTKVLLHNSGIINFFKVW